MTLPPHGSADRVRRVHVGRGVDRAAACRGVRGVSASSRLRFTCIVVSEREAPSLLVNLA
jgi:hypothetical protein